MGGLWHCFNHITSFFIYQHIQLGKSQFLMGRSTIPMAMFNSFVELPVGISINIPVLSHQYPMIIPIKPY